MFSIYAKLGGEDAALSLIAQATGEFPQPHARAKWRLLKRIPANKAVYLLDECVRRGVPALYAQDCVARDPEKGLRKTDYACQEHARD